MPEKRLCKLKMSAITRSSSTIIKEKIKPADISTFLGFNPGNLIPPNSVSVNRYSFELFFEYALRPELGKLSLTSDHIEHGFQVIYDASRNENLKQLATIINHVFLFAFTEILFSDSSIRSNLFLERQSIKCTLSQEEIRQLVDLDPEMTDSISTIFNHLVAPLNIVFDNAFYESLNKFIDDDSAPAVSYLLRHFLHDMSTVSSTIPTVVDPPPLISDQSVEKDRLPQFFKETSSPHIHQRSNPYVEFRMVRVIPTLVICRPKYIPPQLPSLSCIHLPKSADIVVIDRTESASIYTNDNMIFRASENSPLQSLVSHSHIISALALSKCGRFVLSGDTIGYIMIQDLKLGSKCSYQPLRQLITCCSFAPLIPHQFAIGTIDGIVALYDISERKAQRLFAEHTCSVVAVEIHPNSEYIVSISLDATIRVWSVSLGVCVRLFKCAGMIPTVMKISHSGKWLLNGCTNGEVSIIDIGSGKVLKNMKASCAISCAGFSSNDDIIGAIDQNSNFLVWETREGQGEPPESIRIDKTRIMNMEFLDGYEVRIAGCQK